MLPFQKKSKILICAFFLHSLSTLSTLSAFIIEPPHSLRSLRLTRQQGFEYLQRAANESRGLAIDTIGTAGAPSSHLRIPFGCGEIGSMLWGKYLNMNPQDPHWINRDRFVLSAGHGSTFLYSWLHMAGYDLSLEDLQQFCAPGSKTPRHPEWGITPGVEATTGIPGQGIANGIGMACAQKSAQALFNTPEHKIFDAHVFVLCEDKCLQEIINTEAVFFASQQGLDNLSVLFATPTVSSDNISSRFDEYGWEVLSLHGHHLGQLDEILAYVKMSKNKRPKLLICATNTMGKETRENLGIPSQTFHVSNQTHYFFQRRRTLTRYRYEKWQKLYLEWKIKNPEKAFLLEQALYKEEISAKEWLNHISDMPIEPTSTQNMGDKIIQEITAFAPLFISDVELDENRDHAMGAIMNGFAYFGLHRVTRSTLLEYADYVRPAIRLAAMSELPVGYIFTNDSITVGGETLTSFRLIPNLDVIRPADAEETVGACVAMITRPNGPTALVLGTQNVSVLPISRITRRAGVMRGAYIVRQEENNNLQMILMASGSEVSIALETADELGPGVRVISVPSMEIFDRQPRSYREELLPSGCRKRIAIEAGESDLWYKYVGLNGTVVGVDQLGQTKENLVAVARGVLMTNEKP